MEIHFAPETEKKLKDLAAQSGRKAADELVQDVFEGYFDELAQTRTLLNSRCDDLKSGRVKPIPGDEVVIAAVEHFTRLRKLNEVSLYDILHKLIGGSASALRGEVLELLFRLGGKMYFHGSQNTGKPGVRQHPTGAAASGWRLRSSASSRR